MFDEVYRPILENQDRTSVGSKMANDIFASLSSINGPFTAQVANKYWFEVLGIKTEVALETWSETFLYNLLKVAYGGVFKLKFLHSLTNWYMEWNIEKQAKPEKKQQIAEKLKEQPENMEIRYVFDDNVF